MHEMHRGKWLARFRRRYLRIFNVDMSQSALAFELFQIMDVYFFRGLRMFSMGSNIDFDASYNIELIRKMLKNGNSKLSRLKNTLVCHL